MSEKPQRRIQSVEIAAEILESLIACNDSRSLKEIAQATAMSPAKVFPYLVSLIRAGLVIKDEHTGSYSAGTLATELGILGMHFLTPQREGEQTVRALFESTGHGVALSVWGNLGPTVINVTEPPYSLYTQIRLGSVMPLPDSSIGCTFSAWMPQDLIDNAWKRSTGHKPAKAHRERFQRIREEGFAMQCDLPVPGISSVSVPVFELSGAILFTLTLFDESHLLDLSANSPTLLQLRQQAEALSKSLGFKPNHDTGIFCALHALGEQPESRLKKRAK
ncbi:hypothetical protein A8O28_10180 [Enterobacteriaceae bacterium CCUG 67584]|nr:hypothetical protein [Enterobacteriaceae bacterium CCUG 67584]